MALAIISSAKKCPKIKDGRSILPESNCIIQDAFDNETFFIRECSGENICYANTETTVGYCLPYIPFTKLPGEYCEELNECWNKICGVKNKCVGLGLGAECTRHEECNYDLACNYTTGVDGVVPGTCIDAPSSGKCVNGACDPPSVCNKGNCTKFGSVADGEPADNWQACISFYVDEGKCTPQYEKIEDSPKEGICKYSYKIGDVVKNFTEEPVCGNNSELYCNEPRHKVNITNVLLCL